MEHWQEFKQLHRTQRKQAQLYVCLPRYIYIPITRSRLPRATQAPMRLFFSPYSVFSPRGGREVTNYSGVLVLYNTETGQVGSCPDTYISPRRIRTYNCEFSSRFRFFFSSLGQVCVCGGGVHYSTTALTPTENNNARLLISPYRTAYCDRHGHGHGHASVNLSV